MTEVFYTAEMAKAWREIKKPLAFTVDIIGNANCLSVCIYESEIVKMNDMERLKVMNYLNEVANTLQAFGVDIAIEGMPGGPSRF
jgi:hypothetical protein